MAPASENSGEVDHALGDIEYTGRKPGPRLTVVLSVIAALWSIYQLWIASPLPFMFGWGVISDVPARAVHLAFALLLAFLMFPASRRLSDRRLPWYDILTAILACGSALYLFFGWRGLESRHGVLLELHLAGMTIPIEMIIGGVGIVLLLEATRRSIGIPLVLVAMVFLLYSVLGPDVATVIAFIGAIFLIVGIVQMFRGNRVFALIMLAIGVVVSLYAVFGTQVQDILAHKAVSFQRLVGYQWLTGEAVFGIPLDVSTSFVFLFVLFGALLEKAGAGQYFLDLAFALVGRYRGGPAKAAILASGMTGAISGSSIANVVTTGTFTIPIMKRMGMPAVKAGAIEAAASTNGQIMPPIMGAAAFIIAEFLGISYFKVVVAAAIPALTSYMALLYISHLEACKLGLKGLPKAEIPPLWRTFLSGLHFVIPVIVLVYLLMVELWTASSAVFYSILWMVLVMFGQQMYPKRFRQRYLFVPFAIPVLISTALRWGVGMGPNLATQLGLLAGIVIIAGLAVLRAQEEHDTLPVLRATCADLYAGLVAGARNMVTIGIAVAAAGIIVGSVSSTGLNNAMVGVVETISGGNVYILLGMTAMLCLLLGMGLPTTANYLVVASLLAGVLVELGNAAGLVLPLIAVHLFVFYYGLLADTTPPVCLAAFAASAISRADPLKTGVQSFMYDIRTGVLPFIFIFNPELLLVGVKSVWEGILIFLMSLVAIACFSSLTQGWMIVKTRWYESVLLALVMFMLFRPGYFMDKVYPPFETVPMARFTAGDVHAAPGKIVRFHVVRETNYGNRYKLFAIPTPPPDKVGRQGPYGMTLEPADNGRYEVANLDFVGPAKKKGIAMGDYVTSIDVEKPGQPPKQLVYPVGLAILGLVLLLQWIRWRREKADEEGAGPTAAQGA